MKIKFIPFLLIILISAACSNQSESGIIKVLNDREKAFETKDGKLYSSLISKEYRSMENGKEFGKEEIINWFKSNTTPFDNIDIEHSERSIETDGGNDTATVVQKTVVNLKIENETSVYETREMLKLQKKDESWKITKESKMDLFRGFVFGGS